MSAVRRRLWVVWGLLLVLLAAALFVRQGDDSGGQDGHAGDDDADERWLVPAAATELGAVEVVHEGSLHRFERDAAGVWFYHGVHAEADPQHGHTTDPALAQKIDTTLVGFGRSRKERRIPVSEGPAKFGVATPQMIVLVYARSAPQAQPLAQYAIGDLAPDGVSRYVLRVGDKEIVTIPNYQIDNLLGLIQAATAATRQALPPPGGS
ncbi:MAG: DUF4340 domain-containing protein [Burkholderiales bacterium]|nr:DUF4340 domain-containing protein [Burkholderiales bacterium]